MKMPRVESFSEAIDFLAELAAESSRTDGRFNDFVTAIERVRSFHEGELQYVREESYDLGYQEGWFAKSEDIHE